MVARGRPRKHEGETTAFTVRLPAETVRELRVWSAASGRSLNDVIEEAVRKLWDRHPQRKAMARVVRETGKK